ncbi:MAG: hypothetical protein Q8O13_04915 [Candidatus Omnitrophota bacterium]|nr:hypothetical protein [Candidatus Omnitrophota bacterium]
MKREVKYYLNHDGKFVIENFSLSPPFTNFFPGIAGVWGIPMWVFYCNRGQAIGSFGIEGKDKAILEFLPANKAYRTTPTQGFRTFLKINSGNKKIFYEPFSNNPQNLNFQINQKMSISSYDLTIEEENKTIGLNVTINYFTIPNEPFSALVRQLTIKNASTQKMNLELVDGLPVVIPYGLPDRLLKDMCRTIEAWFEVVNLEKKAPFYNLKVEVSDKPYVSHIKEGNFFVSFYQENNKATFLEPIVNTSCVFGTVTGFGWPQKFLLSEHFKTPKRQITDNVTPCAFGYLDFNLKPLQEKTIISLIGHISSQQRLNSLLKTITSKDYIFKKSLKNKEIIERLQSFSLTASSSREFNLYCQQFFLDNVMRGGLPLSLETHEGKVIFYVFSRKHGDPERDYNKFVLSPTYLSQGNGSFRDVNQNRRNDVWFNPDVKDSNIVSFFNLVQADGFNPLVIKGTSFVIDDPENLDEILNSYVEDKDKKRVKELLKRPFVPGELLLFIEENDINLKTTPKEFFKKVLTHCHKIDNAEHGEGFWTDHWTYNTDLLESYLAIYPKELREILLDKKDFIFYRNDARVASRDKKYILTPNGPRQYHSVLGKHEDMDFVNEAISLGENKDSDKLKTKNGKGEVYLTNLIVKILCIIANKIASLDPFGVGIEMEANKPNWYDALNGLPSLFGSSICETIELKRLAMFLRKAINELDLKQGDKINIFEELFDFIAPLTDLLKTESDNFKYWDISYSLKEDYRCKILLGISGAEKAFTIGNIKEFLDLVIAKTTKAINCALDNSGICRTYFINEVKEYQILSQQKDNETYIRPLKFSQRPLPLFLEGPVHALKIEGDIEKAKMLYKTIRKSELFDKKLKMYKVNGYLSKETEEIGRTKVFPRGWLENESIWLHMEYKYLLEVLRSGLHEDFFRDFKNCLVPFLNPKRYARSILENSSFIVSSVHQDKSLHGAGFVARLSGSTAELIHIWLTMNVGKKPFRWDNKSGLCLEFKPILANWLFTNKKTEFDYFTLNEKRIKIKLPKNSYAFNFLGSTLVAYHNPKRKNTFGKNAASIKQIILTYLNGRKMKIDGGPITSPYSEEVRDRKFSRIDIELE